MDKISAKWLQEAKDYLEFQVRQGLTEVIIPPFVEPSGPLGPLDVVRNDLGECARCPLHRTRKKIVFGEGAPAARLMFVGEGPGADEDLQGKPFVGRAGQLLTRMIEAMGLTREDVYITNIVKCRPPGNRDPEALEIETCFPFLERQIKAISPEVIVALGRISAGTLLGAKAPLSRLRGRFHDRGGIPIMPTYHPSFLLRQERERRWKGEAWADLKLVMGLLGLSGANSGDTP
ncbi:MAG: uracil-DNA glycosylase [Deltaproteobacteria bacterium]|nr:uracil-DNA glycosylase [Deltaproteobacteria bacterium]